MGKLSEIRAEVEAENHANVRWCIEDYLDELGCTLWRDWDIKNPASRKEAVDWAEKFWFDVENRL